MCEIAKIDQALLSCPLDYDKKTVVKDQKKLDSQVVAQNLKKEEIHCGTCSVW